jgi:hypothetical protein
VITEPTTRKVEERSKRGRGAVLLALAVAALLAAFTLQAAKSAHAAATFTVDRTGDPDPTTASACTDAPDDCSLRGAIVAANSADGPDAITVPAGDYTLTRAGASEVLAATGDLNVTGDLTITGAGARSTSVIGGPAPFDDRVFEIQPGATATITGLTITGGKTGDSGGGVFNWGDLTLNKVAVNNNTAGAVGGILGLGGTLNLIDSTVSGNTSTSALIGGVGQERGTANITNSTISGNRTGQNGLGGGVLATDGALMKIRNSTIASNQSGRLGGGILTLKTGTLVTVKNTIVAGNSLDNCDTAQFSGGIISSQGNNISSDDSCPFTEPTDRQNSSPLLGPLQDNGGPTDTRALLAGSPAIDAGSASACPPRDQRGVARKDGDGDGTVLCDIGAFEAPTNTRPTITNPRPAPGSTTRDRTPSIAATVRDAQTDLAKPDIDLFVDGNRRDFSYDRSTDRLSFVPGSRLSFGKHTVKVVADDSVLSATKSWSFGVVRG